MINFIDKLSYHLNKVNLNFIWSLKFGKKISKVSFNRNKTIWKTGKLLVLIKDWSRFDFWKGIINEWKIFWRYFIITSSSHNASKTNKKWSYLSFKARKGSFD